MAPSTLKVLVQAYYSSLLRGNNSSMSCRYTTKASNNGAKYEALIHGLHIEVSLGIKRLLAFGEYKVVIEQVNKEWDCVKDTMDAYCAEIHKLEGHFEGIEFQHVPRNNNVAANVLSKLGSRRALVPAGVFVQDLRKPSIKLLDPDSPDLPQH
jgi:ribonuclease HI